MNEKKIIIERIESNIINEGKQKNIRIPAEIINRFQINSEKDIFVWDIIKEDNQISVKGILLKNVKKISWYEKYLNSNFFIFVIQKMVYRQKRYKKQRLVYGLSQVGQVKDKKRDKSIKALRSGKRISRTGNEYTETRKNRSDVKGRTYP